MPAREAGMCHNELRRSSHFFQLWDPGAPVGLSCGGLLGGPMSASELLDQYRLQACSPQWRGFVLAMADEFAEALPETDVARLMARIGERFARSHGLAPVASLAELEAAANAVWAGLSWGTVRLREEASEVLVEHSAAPLTALLADHGRWNASFLEGVYRAWFRTAGMLPSLDLEAGVGGSPDVSRFVLRRMS